MRKIEEIPLSEREAEILREIRDVVKAVLPDAAVIFFGSRARGNALEHSDWDILVLNDTVTPEIEHEVFSALYDVELERDIVIGPLVLPRDEWENKRFKNHPIHKCVDEDGALV